MRELGTLLLGLSMGWMLGIVFAGATTGEYVRPEGLPFFGPFVVVAVGTVMRWRDS